MASLHAIKHTDKNHAPIRVQVRELREEAEGGARGASVLHVNYEEHGWFRYRRSAEGGLGFEAQGDSNVWRPLGYSEERKGLLSVSIQHSLEGQQVHCLLPKIITSWILENKCLAEDVPQNRPASDDNAAHITREGEGEAEWVTAEGWTYTCKAAPCDVGGVFVATGQDTTIPPQKMYKREEVTQSTQFFPCTCPPPPTPHCWSP